MDVTKLLFTDLLSAVFSCHVQLLNLMQQRRHLDEQRRRLLLSLANRWCILASRHCCLCFGICCTSPPRFTLHSHLLLWHMCHIYIASLGGRFYSCMCTELFWLLLLHHLCGRRILFNRTSAVTRSGVDRASVRWFVKFDLFVHVVKCSNSCDRRSFRASPLQPLLSIC